MAGHEETPNEPDFDSARDRDRRFHRLLLSFFPPGFRDTHGDQMIAFWLEQTRESRYRGWTGRCRLVLHLLRDAVRTRARAGAKREGGHRPTGKLRHGSGFRWRSVQHSIRSLRRTPGFTLVAGLTLALGIGAPTAVFAVVNSVLWRSLPYANADRLVVVERLNVRYASGVSWPDFRDWRAQARGFEGLAAWREDEATFGFGDGSELVDGAAISRDLLDVVGVNPILGRRFNADEDRLGGVDAVILSYGMWHERYGGDRSVVGRRIMVDGESLEIVGVMDRDFAFPGEARYWRPLQDDALLERIGLPTNSRTLAFLRVIGRLEPGADARSAASNLSALHTRIREDAGVPDESHRILVEDIRSYIVGDVRTTLFFLLGSALLVLLVACANVAGLALARSGLKEREFAVRAALGAGRSDLRLHAMSESMVLALGAGAAGCGLALLLTRSMLRLAPAGIPRLAEATVDGRAWAFALVVTLLTGVAFGLAPALRVARVDPIRNMSSGLRVTGGDRLSLYSQHALVVAQVAVAVTLLSAAGLLWRSYTRLMSVDPGYVTENVFTAWVAPPISKYDTPAGVTAFYRILLERVRALPGVVGATTTYAPPLRSNGLRVSVAREGENPAEEEAVWINSVVVGDAFFDVSGIPLLAGRRFNAQDRVDAPPVVIVSRATADRLWPDGAVGQKFRYMGGVGGSAESFDSLTIPRQSLTVIGVVADVRRDTLSARPPLEFYRPHEQVPWASQYLVLRTSGPATNIDERLREAVWSIDATVPLRSVEALATQFRDHTAETRFRSFLVVTFATLAGFLAMLGIYAVLAISVARRTREIGIRVALGATGADLHRAVLARGMRLVAAGGALGLVAALLTGQVLASMLYELAPADPVTLASVLLLTLFAAVLACWVPAYRASRVDPVRSLQRD